MKHIICAQEFTEDFLNLIFADAMRNENLLEIRGQDTSLKGKIVKTFFQEESTRTRLSFEAAALRLGADVISTPNASFSSLVKGETLEDATIILGQYVDTLIIRAKEAGALARAAAVAKVPIINAGDGRGQHPTQALLDIYTIHKELHRIDEVSIAFVGDLKNGRPIRSLAYLLGKRHRITIYFVSPSFLRVGADIKEYLTRHHVQYVETENLDPLIDKVDVLYMTRLQNERAETAEEKSAYAKYEGCFIIDRPTADRMKRDAIIMHPLPRRGEIATDVDTSPHAKYIKQAYYGLPVRMALLKYVLSE